MQPNPVKEALADLERVKEFLGATIVVRGYGQEQYDAVCRTLKMLEALTQPAIPEGMVLIPRVLPPLEGTTEQKLSRVEYTYCPVRDGVTFIGQSDVKRYHLADVNKSAPVAGNLEG